jgi:hypothetical protein
MPVALPACADDAIFKLENATVTTLAVLAGIVPAVSDTTSSVLPENAQDAVTPDIPVPVIEDTPGAVAVSKNPEGYVSVILAFKAGVLENVSPPPSDVLNISLALDVTFEATRSVLSIEKLGPST